MQPKAWSHSALKAFETCPKKYYMTTVEKRFTEHKGEAVTWGSEVHKAFEDYFKTGKPFPIGMRQFQTVADSIKAAVTPKVEELTETKLAINRDFQPVGYFDRDVWVRCVVDYGIKNGSKALIVDWKTGKKSQDSDQLALMAGMMFAQAEELTQITSSFVWLKEPKGNQMDKLVFSRENTGEIWDRFLRRVEAFEEAFVKEDFPAKPNGLCRRFCPVTSCPYNGT